MATILVVDDKHLNRSVLTTLLGYGGHRLLEASGGWEAIEITRLENPELVISDILMPNMDGYELVRRIRELDSTKQPKVIFYSATYLEDEARALARACGVSQVICKPAEPEQILRAVEEALACGRTDAPPMAERVANIEAIKVLSNKLYHKIEEVEELNAQLERRVSERTLELENANRLLQQQVVERQRAEEEALQSREKRLRMKGEFLSHVSHELRSPLAVVHQFTTILLDGLGGPLTPNQHEYLEISLRNVNQLKFMIDDLLEASRADTSKLAIKRSPIGVAEVVAQSVKSHASIAAEKNITLKTDLPGDLPAVYADPTRISQVLTNVLDNALKFSPPGTVVTIRARIAEHDPSLVCVSVADCGCGIEPEDAERVFDRLYQVEQATCASRRGLGLGLYICKELINLHGGRIWIDGKSITGATVHFTLPVFALESMIAPVLMQEGRLTPTLALIKVAVSPAQTWRSERDRERALQKIHRILERCLLPDLDVLLPAQNRGGSDFFNIVARTDERGAQVLLSRIREQLSRCEDLKNSRVDCSTGSEVMDLESIAKGLPLEKCVACVASHLQQQLSTTNQNRR